MRSITTVMNYMLNTSKVSRATGRTCSLSPVLTRSKWVPPAPVTIGRRANFSSQRYLQIASSNGKDGPKLPPTRPSKATTDGSDAASDDATDPTNQEEESDAEAAAYNKRAEESQEAGVESFIRPPRGGDPPPAVGRWEWTLNWDPIEWPTASLEELGDDQKGPDLATVAGQARDAEAQKGEGQIEQRERAEWESKLFCGSCPRTPDDVDRLVDEAGVEAILCLQSDVCFEAMDIDWEGVQRRAVERQVLIVRVPVIDFDRLDQANMLPEMVRRLGTLMALGLTTYVHCTAGINRASITVLGYLTFVEALKLETALDIVRGSRPQAHPYIECWKAARERMLAGKEHDLYLATQMRGNSMDEGDDWLKRDWERAERAVIAAHYKRCIASDVSAMQAAIDVAAVAHKAKSS